MYTSKAAAASSAGTATLAFTGVNALFYVVAGFTLIMAGLALIRLAPRTER